MNLNSKRIISDKGFKYPASRLVYNTLVGEIRENRILKAIKTILPNHFKVGSHKVNVNGPDICISHNGKTVAKFEILNENTSSYIDKKRALRIRKNLKGVLYKGLICSHLSSINGVKKIMKNIPVLAVGFQTLPSNFHRFYQNRNQIFKRKIADSRSFKLLKNCILSFFFKIGLVELMYIPNTLTNNKKGMAYVETNNSKNSGVRATEDKCTPHTALKALIIYERLRQRFKPSSDNEKRGDNANFSRKIQN